MRYLLGEPITCDFTPDTHAVGEAPPLRGGGMTQIRGRFRRRLAHDSRGGLIHVGADDIKHFERIAILR
jgi:hypothetical protein